MDLKRIIPILNWLPSYNKESFKGDLGAGLTVGVMLIPQGMAYSMLAGLPPIYGLYASIIPLIVYAIFGTSRQLAVGPVAMVSLLVAAGVGNLAETGSESFVSMAIVLALLVGFIQLAMGVFRLGFLVNFLSHPVISGFTSAAALIIGFSQLKHLLGISIPRSNYIHEIVWGAVEQSSEINLYTLIIGVVAIAAMLVIKRMKFPIPGPLVAVALGILGVWFFQLDALGVKIVREVPSGLPAFQVPKIQGAYLTQLLPIALTISFISFMESIAVAKAVQAKHRDYKVIPNQELMSLGLANIFGSFFQSFPVTGGFSRTAVNDQAGAKSGMASIISALLIGLTLLFLTPVFYYLPNAILASIIMVAVFGLIDVKELFYLWRTDKRDLVMLLVTFLGTLLLGIEEGILIGVILSIALIVYQTTKPHTAVLGKLPGKPHYKNMDRFPDLLQREDILIYRFDARLYFANVTYFVGQIEQLVEEKGPSLRLFILDADSINGMDSSALHALHEVYENLVGKGIKLYMVGVKGPVRDALHRDGFIENLGKENFFMRIQHAVDAFDQKPIENFQTFNIQTNEAN